MNLFNSLNYQNPNEPDYLDPHQIYDEELDMCVTVEDQKEALEDFLLRVVNRTPYLSLPNKEKKPEEFERVYQQLETMLRHILEKIKTEPPQEKALYLNMLAISGRKCGTRNIQETTQLYLRATHQTKSLEQLTSFPLMVQYELRQLVQKITYALIPSGGENAHALQVVSKALKGESTLQTAYTDPFEASGEVSTSTVKEQFHALCDPIYLVTQVINLIATHHKTTICGTEIDLYDLSLEWFKTQTSRNNSYAYLSELFNMEGAIEELPLGKITPIAALDLLKKLGILKEAI